MTEGGNVSGPTPRLRIKGRWQSVVRFFSISVAFMVLWILVTSQLGHYSKLFGPQILLQLNLAFYLPSIPVLLLSGSLERWLDSQLGPIGSLALRLNGGLAGCAATAALFPALPGLTPGDGPLWPLLAAVGVLGGLSAVAFSTSYQLVQFFRAADTISLGVGCVGAGPLVLLVQLALGVGPTPAKWQWIAMYEISAGFIAAGLASSSSLCGQYWNRLNEAASRGAAATTAADASNTAGGGGGAEHRVPLLAAADGDAAAAAAPDAEAAWPGLEPAAAGVTSPLSSPSPYGRAYVVRPLSPGGGGRVQLGGRARPGELRRRPTTAPDPFNVFSLLTTELDGGFDWGDDDDDDSAPPVLLRRSASAGVEGSRHSAAAAAARRKALAAVGLDRSSHGRIGGGAGSGTASATLYSQYVVALPNVKPTTPPTSPAPAPLPVAAATTSPVAPPPPLQPPLGGGGGGLFSTPPPLTGMVSAPAKMVRHGASGGRNAAADAAATGGGGAAAAPLLGGILEFGVPDEEPAVPTPHGGASAASAASQPPHHEHNKSYGTAASSFATSSASELLAQALQVPEPERAEPSSLAAAAAAGPGGVLSASASEGPLPGLESLEEEAVVTVGVEGKGEAVTEEALVPMPMTMRQEVTEVLKGSWQVMLGFTVDVTLLYIVFPFFTYVHTSGWLGDSLPQVLFYARLFTDLVGRLLPRRRSLQLRSGTAILSLAAVSTAAAALFFAYILAPARLVGRAPGLLRNDGVPLGLVVFLWITGGYTNTLSNMLAPSLVAPHLAGRASALMALLFNVAHIGGLVIAATLAAVLFGDVVG
ncbi:hypothetical protein PLESTB_000003400 [Pleodorina starrii]|uniref:Uncharacterized protein n=1 Tax=Pleodorina starrii TaxID=330485 RepID=A0A9W6EWQ7_9CHLO|nr:hypothetical protein PLESTB_000003400 [Pleodorina starrii]